MSKLQLGSVPASFLDGVMDTMEPIDEVPAVFGIEVVVAPLGVWCSRTSNARQLRQSNASMALVAARGIK